MSRKSSALSDRIAELEQRNSLLFKQFSVDQTIEENEKDESEPTVKQQITHIFHSKSFHLAIVLLCCLDGLLVICMLLLEIEVLKLSPSSLRANLVLTQFIFECTSLAIVSLFLVEVPIKIWLFGAKFFGAHWLELIDAVVCIVSFAVDVFNIVRHMQHGGHGGNHGLATRSIVTHGNHTLHITDAPHELTLEEQTKKSVQNTLADAASLLVLFRLWRVIRIINAIVISVTTSKEGAMERLRAAASAAEERISQLEALLAGHNITIPPASKMLN